MRKVNELKAGSILTYVNLLISCVIPLVYTPIMLRILGQAEYGLYGLSNSVISYLSLLTFGMGGAVVRYVTKSRVTGNKDEERDVVGLFLLIFLVLAVIVCIAGVVLTIGTDLFFGKGLTETEISKLKILLVIMTNSTAISFIVSIFASVVISYEKYIFRKLFECATSILAPILNLIVLYAGYATIGMALVGFAVQVATLVLFVLYCRKKLDIYPRFSNVPTHMLKEIWGFSAFVFISTLVDLLYWATDKVLIGGMLGTIAVAVYNVGGTFTTMLQNLSSAVSGVFGTKVTAMVFEKRPMTEFSELLIRIGRIQYLIVSLVLSGYIVFGKSFLCFWAGEEYIAAYGIGLVTMIPLAIPLIESIAYSTIIAMNKHRFRAKVYAIAAVVNLIATIIVIPKFGIMGAAVCTGIAFIAGNGIILNIYYYKEIGLDMPRFWKNIITMSIVPVIFIIVTNYIFTKLWLLDTIYRFAGAVVVYTILFAVASWIFTMNKYEKNLILGLFKLKTR